MSDAQWLYRSNDTEVGPFSEQQVAALLATKAVDRDTPVRGAGDDAWLPLSDAFAFARAVPPPLPDIDSKERRLEPWTDVSPHPWRRYFAKVFDMLVLAAFSWFAIGLIGSAVAPDALDNLLDQPQGRWQTIAETMISVPMALIWCAVFTGLSGGTPGKWLFGIRVVDHNGRPPGIFAGLKREAMVWVAGLGLAIPFANLVAMATSYSHLDKHKKTLWDSHLDLTVVHRPDGSRQVALTFAAVALWLVLLVSLKLAAQ